MGMDHAAHAGFLSHDLPHIDHGSNYFRNHPEHHCWLLHLEISK